MGEAPAGRVIVVCADAKRACQLAESIGRAGFSAFSSTDIGWALDENPSVLVLDPTGWETTAKAILSGYDSREYPPPAVILVGSEETLPYTVGPSLFFFREPLQMEELLVGIRIGMRRREYFAYHWPRVLSAKSGAGTREVEKILAARTGITVREDWISSFARALQERMVANLVPTVSDYERLLSEEGGEREIHMLACRVAVGETHFWRYSGQMNALKTLLANIAGAGSNTRRLKIWSAGCSTGEEPYSTVMAAMEALGEEVKLDVFGTDINSVSLTLAKIGSYSERSLRNLPIRLQERFFEPKGRMRRIKNEVKLRVHFSQVNLCLPEAREWAKANGPFDAVFCRNVTIYFSSEVGREVVKLCSDSLRVGGGLFLGSSETLHPLLPGLTVVQAPGAFYYLKGQPTPPPPPPPVEEPATTTPPAPEEAAPGVKKLDPAARRAIFEKGLDAVGREDFTSAKAAFDELLERDPQCPLGKTGTALVLTNQGREVEARQLLNRVVFRRDEPAEAHFILGLLDERAHAPEAALAHYAKTLRIDPDFFMAHVNAAWILKREGRGAEGMDQMRKALSILRRSVRISPWVTGGLGLEAILSLVAEASDDGEAAG